MNKNPAMNYINYDNHVKKRNKLGYLNYTKMQYNENFANEFIEQTNLATLITQ